MVDLAFALEVLALFSILFIAAALAGPSKLD